MSRVRFSLNVCDLDAPVAFYTRLLGAPRRAWEYYTGLERVETP